MTDLDPNARLKHLLKSVLGVDVDAIARRILAGVAIERAVAARRFIAVWERAQKEEGHLVVLPARLRDMGRRG